jgi:single-stranded-DNA-specific exonuclease
MVKMSGQDQDPIICVAHEDFHQGISGLVAGALKDRYNRPACVAAFVEGEDGRQEGRGSGRSVKGVNIAQSFIDGRNKGLLIKGGGHAMAGGFTVERGKFDEFCAFLKQHVGAQAPETDDTPVTDIDAALSVGAASIDFVRIIEHHMGPYGMGNPEPVFMLKNVLVGAPDIVGANHVRCFIRDAEGGRSIKGICFRSSNTELGEALLAQQKGQSIPMHLLGSFHINTWLGRESVDFHISDAAFAL